MDERAIKLNSTAAALLGFLHRGPMTGWDLAQMAETVIGKFWHITRSQVYRELRSLEEQALVQAGPPGKRDKRPYSITDAGRSAFANWIRQEPGPGQIRSPLLLMVFFGSHLDQARKQRFLEIHRLRHEQALEEYLSLRDAMGDSEPDLANVLQMAIFYQEAVLRWLDWMSRSD